MILFYEYFHGDNGAGIGASHQTGWTAGIPRLMTLFGRLTPQLVLAEHGILSGLEKRTDMEAPGAHP